MKFKLFFVILLFPIMNYCMEKEGDGRARRLSMEANIETAVGDITKKNTFKMTGVLLFYKHKEILQICDKCIDTVFGTVRTSDNREIIPFDSITRLNFREKDSNDVVVKIYDDNVYPQIQSKFWMSNEIAVHKKIAKCVYKNSIKQAVIKNIKIQFVNNKSNEKLIYLLYNKPHEIISKRVDFDKPSDSSIIH